MNNAFLNKLIATDAGWALWPSGSLSVSFSPPMAHRNCLAGLAATAWKVQDNGWIPSG